MQIDRLDHLVLTVGDVEASCDFYAQVLGMEVITFGEGRNALKFGNQKINLHLAGSKFDPKALRPTPGSGDLCFMTSISLEHVMEHLRSCQVELVDGPVVRTGAISALRSIYLRDPDGNLIEISNQVSEDA